MFDECHSMHCLMIKAFPLIRIPEIIRYVHLHQKTDRYPTYLIILNIPGTNLNVRQRLALFFMYICTIMFVNGIFYGLDQSPIQDVVASFIISLGGTAPQLIIKLLFKNAKPRDTSSTKSAKIEQSKADPALVEMAKIKCAREMREKMYNGMYPLPPYVREIAWILLFVVFAAACVAAVCSTKKTFSHFVVALPIVFFWMCAFRSFMDFQLS